MNKLQQVQIARLSRLLEAMNESGALDILAHRCDTGGSISDVRDAAFAAATPRIREHGEHAMKGRMYRGGFEPRDWTVECGAHGCDKTVSVQCAESLRLDGWHFDKRGGYGWICPKCQEGGPFPGGSMKPAAHDCAKSAPYGFLTGGYRQDGERWTCPDCGKTWEHACDEAEGCAWFPVPAKRAKRAPSVLQGEPRV